VKISFMGAGSIRYTLKLVGDLAKTKELSGSLVSLMDVDEERLEAVYDLAKRYIDEVGGNLKLEKTTDREKSLQGADFVINTALYRAPGHEDGYVSYEIMRDLAERYGYYRGIDSQEFNMVSDYYTFTNYNHLKLSLDIAKSIEEICPDAYFIQTANPVFEITELVLRHTNVKVVGFCHGFSGLFEVFHTLGLNPEEVDWQVAGVNHGIWLNRFLYRGENAYPLLDKWIEEESQHWQPENPWDVQLSPAVIDMYKFYGMLPIGDTCRNGSWKYNYNLETKKKWYGKFGGIDNEVERPRFHESLRKEKQKLLDLAEEVRRNPEVDLFQAYPEIFTRDKMSGEQHIPFINGISGGPEARLILNLQNRGVISGIPDDVVVEIPVIVSKDNIQPEKLDPDVTERTKNMYLMPRILRMRWALEAYTTGDKRVLEEILVRDPRTKSFEQVKAVLEEIMSLPINEEIARYFGYK